MFICNYTYTTLFIILYRWHTVFTRLSIRSHTICFIYIKHRAPLLKDHLYCPWLLLKPRYSDQPRSALRFLWADLNSSYSRSIRPHDVNLDYEYYQHIKCFTLLNIEITFIRVRCISTLGNVIWSVLIWRRHIIKEFKTVVASRIALLARSVYEYNMIENEDWHNIIYISHPFAIPFVLSFHRAPYYKSHSSRPSRKYHYWGLPLDHVITTEIQKDIKQRFQIISSWATEAKKKNQKQKTYTLQ